MTTWRLWRALRNPPALHPIFQRTVLLPHKTVNSRPGQHITSWAGLVVKVVLGLGEYNPLVLLILMPLILMFIGITYGMDCAIRVGNLIAREHERDTFNLLSLSPSGALGTSWAMCTSSLHRNRDFDRLYEIVRGTLMVAGIGIFTLAVLVMAVNSDTFTRFPQPALPTFAHGAVLLMVMAAVYIEYVQSTVLGSLIGMVVPTYTQNRLDTSIYTFGIFALLQVSTYLLTYMVGFIVLPPIWERLAIDRNYLEIGLTGARLFIFFAVREIILTILWRRLVERLNAYPSELDLAMQAIP
jgi:hypothetical protein